MCSWMLVGDLFGLGWGYKMLLCHTRRNNNVGAESAPVEAGTRIQACPAFGAAHQLRPPKVPRRHLHREVARPGPWRLPTFLPLFLVPPLPMLHAANPKHPNPPMHPAARPRAPGRLLPPLLLNHQAVYHPPHPAPPLLRTTLIHPQPPRHELLSSQQQHDDL